MLKLELVRFKYSPVVTFGVVHSRDGWSAFTGESVVLNLNNPPKGKAALPEGLYELRLCKEGETPGAVELFDAGQAPPVSRFTLLPRAAMAQGNIIIGYGLDSLTGALSDTVSAHHELADRVAKVKEAFLNIRHLDNTQLIHFERMAREFQQ